MRAGRGAPSRGSLFFGSHPVDLGSALLDGGREIPPVPQRSCAKRPQLFVPLRSGRGTASSRSSLRPPPPPPPPWRCSGPRAPPPRGAAGGGRGGEPAPGGTRCRPEPSRAEPSRSEGSRAAPQPLHGPDPQSSAARGKRPRREATAGRAAKAPTMTAESTEPNGPMREPTVGGTKPSAPPAPPRRRGRRLRRKSLPEVAVKGQLRMRSPSGAFVMVGISVVLVGMTIAVVGYWPHRGHGGAGAGAGNASTAGDMRREVVAGRPTPHNEKLKLIGPVIMGIGLFIFICANTMLYENRDMETRMLMQKGLYCMATDLPKETSPKDEDTQLAPKASPECLEGCYEVDLSLGSKWADGFGPNRLQTTAELMQCPGASPAASLLSLHSEANLGLSTTVGALALPIIKLNNRLLDAASRGANGMTEGAHLPTEGPVPSCALLSPSGSSVAPRGLENHSGHVVINMEDGGPAVDVGPDAQPHNPGHSKSLDLGRPGVLLVAPIKDRKNRSWPRLDHVNAVAYAKLENWGESLDRLLETSGTPHHAEPRPSSWVVGMEGGSRV